MTTKPRRYVRVMKDREADTWDAECDCCTWVDYYSLHATAVTCATGHASRCPAVATAAERDQLAQEVQRLEDDLATAYADHMHDLVRLTTHAARTEIERDQWRTTAHELAAELLLRDERKETP